MTKQADGSFAGDITINDGWPDGETSVDNVYVLPQDGSSAFLRYYTHLSAGEINETNSDISEISYSGFR